MTQTNRGAESLASDVHETTMTRAGTVAVLGGTGQIGRHVVAELSRRGVAHRVLTRRPSRPGEFRADLSERSGLPGALTGCASMLLLTADAPDQAERELAAVDAAVRAGIGHVVKISAQLAGLEPPVSFGAVHRPVEQALQAKPLTWTLLRPTLFAQSLSLFAPDLTRCRRLIAPFGRAPIAFVDVRDIAAVAVAALLRNDLTGRILTLTGPAAVTVGEVADMLSDRLGHRVRYLSPPMPLARWHLRMTQARWRATLLADGAAALRRGAHSRPTSDLADVLGRPGRTVEALLDEQLPPLYSRATRAQSPP